MSSYIVGLGGNCCSTCTPNDPCAAAPRIISCSQGLPAYVGTSGTWGSYTTQNTAGATWSATGLPSGLTINSGTGFITGTPTTATSGTLVVVTATNSCGASPCSFTFTVYDCRSPGCFFVGVGSSVSTPDNGVVLDDSYDTTGEFNCATPVTLAFTITDGSANILVKANTVTIYSTGCETSDGTAYFTMPAGTTTVRVIVTAGCSGDGVALSYSLECT